MQIIIVYFKAIFINEAQIVNIIYHQPVKIIYKLYLNLITILLPIMLCIEYTIFKIFLIVL